MLVNYTYPGIDRRFLFHELEFVGKAKYEKGAVFVSKARNRKNENPLLKNPLFVAVHFGMMHSGKDRDFLGMNKTILGDYDFKKGA